MVAAEEFFFTLLSSMLMRRIVNIFYESFIVSAQQCPGYKMLLMIAMQEKKLLLAEFFGARDWCGFVGYSVWVCLVLFRIIYLKVLIFNILVIQQIFKCEIKIEKLQKIIFGSQWGYPIGYQNVSNRVPNSR